MSLLSRIFGGRSDRSALRPLYDAAIAAARRPLWYRDGGVPDTIDGRFDMVAVLLALVLLRLEKEPDSARAAVLLTELFIDDMEGTVRQIGIGDVMVGKHVGKMVGALGGRLEALRAADIQGLERAIRHNVFHDAPPPGASVAFVAAALGAFRDGLAVRDRSAILAGDLP